MFITSRAYKVLGLIRRSFSSSLDIRAKRTLYLLLVRSQLTHGSQIWRPHLIKDFMLLERIQRRATNSSGSRGVSEVSTETPFCCDSIIAHISRTRAADFMLDCVRRARTLARHKYLRTPSAYIRSDYRTSRDFPLSTLQLHVKFSTLYSITETGQW